MSHHHTISLPMAILININIILGAGIFVNTVPLARIAGAAGGFAYILVGILLLPLVFSVMNLLKLHPSGGYYTFGAKEIHPFAGFIGTWCYFAGKISSATLAIHIAVLLLQELFPALEPLSTLGMDIVILSLFLALNTLNLKTGGTIQSFFLGMKIVPILFVILFGIFCSNGTFLSQSHFIWSGLPIAVPLILYAVTGFEAACSFSSHIHNAKKNAPRAVLFSFIFVIITVTFFQLLLYAVAGPELTASEDYRSTFPAFLRNLFFLSENSRLWIKSVLHLGIVSSALGGSYSAFFSNMWNLHTLAQHEHTFLYKILKHLNNHGIPTACIAAEGLLALCYLLITQGKLLPLQFMGAFGNIIGTTMAVIALIQAKKNNPNAKNFSWIIPICAFINCLLLVGTTIRSTIITQSYSALCIFPIIICFGTWMYLSTNQNKSINAS